METVGWDLDETLVFLIDPFCMFHNENYGTNLKRTDFLHFELHKVLPIPLEEEKRRVYEFFSSPYTDLIKPIPGMPELLQKHSNYRHIIITARDERMPTKGCVEYFTAIRDPPFLAGYYDGCRSKVDIGVAEGVVLMVEDSYANAVAFRKKGIRTLLVTAPWNIHFQEDGEYIRRVESPEQIHDYLSSL